MHYSCLETGQSKSLSQWSCVGWSGFFFFLGMFFIFKICVNGERQIPLFDFPSLEFLCYFLFWKERDIKFEQKYLFILNLTEVDYGKQTEHTSGGQSDTF